MTIMATSFFALTQMTIVGHVILGGLFLAAQSHINPYLPLYFVGFGLMTMIVVPLTAGIFMANHCYSVGAALLVSSLVGAAVLGISRFILIDMPHPIPASSHDWASIGHLTANLLLLFEAVGCWLGWRFL